MRTTAAAGATGRDPRLGRALAPLAALLAYCACRLLAPAVVNGDGLGHLRAAAAGAPLPGHLGWLPLLSWLARATAAPDALALLGPARQLCWLSAAAAAACTTAAARRLSGDGAALVAGLGLVGSYGFLEAGADVETYAPALAAMAAALYAAARRAGGGGAGWLVVTALSSAAAALLHIENLLFIPVAALVATGPRLPAAPSLLARLRAAAAIAVPALFLVVLAYALALPRGGGHLGAALRFVGGASHGFRYPLGPATPVIALYGMARTLVYSPYPFEASWPWLLAQTALGGGALLGLARLGAGAAPPAAGGAAFVVGRAAALCWALPYAAVGVAFFASDSERWLFLLPLAWMLAGDGAARSPGRLRAGLLLGAGLLALSLGLGLPRAHDPSRRQRADAAAALMADGDLVVSPGHGWDEYVGFYSPRRVERFPMIYFCGALGGREAMTAELALRVERARQAGHRVYWLRGDEPATREGWKDLALFGVTPASAPALLPGRPVAVAAGVDLLEATVPSR